MLKPYLLPAESLPGLYKDYLQNLPQATRFLGAHYQEPALFATKAQQVCAGFTQDREALTHMLLDYNKGLGCSVATEAQIEKLRDRQAVAVLCGQQAGLLSGPLYTIYKAVAAVKLAKKLEQELARPVVPVFWIAAEDHDFSEANHCYVMDQENRPQKIQLDLPHEGEPMGLLPLTDPAAEHVLTALRGLVPETEFLPGVTAMLEQARRRAATPVDWFARIMSSLFSAEGLVLFDPLLPQARAMASQVFQTAILRRQEAQDAMALREAALRAEGYPLQVEREADATLLMRMGKKRTALYWRNGSFTTRDGSQSYSREELLAIADSSPAALSPNVLLRPLVQDTIFPTLAFIPGPGETAYLAQVTALYPLFGIEAPVLWPRPGLTLLEPRLARYLKKYGVAEGELLTGLDDALQRELKNKNDLDLDSVFEHLRSHLALEYDHLKRDLGKVNPQLPALADKNLQHVYSQVRYLEEKAREEYKKKNEVMIRHFDALEQAVKPYGKLQERVYCILPFLIKYGPAFWEQLTAQFPDQPGHYLLYL